MDRSKFLFLFHFTIFLLLTFTSFGLSSIGKKRTQDRIGPTKEHYMSKSYGEIQFNKYKGQLPPKGSILGCAIECMTLASCHCLALNVHTAECNFFDMDQSPDYSNWKAESNTTGLGDVNVTKNDNNYINNDFIFFTRDILDPNQPSKLDISSNRKWLTSSFLDQYYPGKNKSSSPSSSSSSSASDGNTIGGASKKLSKQSKNASSSKSSKPTNSKTKQKNSTNSGPSSIDGQFPYPWLQIEFKDSMYLTEIALQTTRGIDDLKHFQIRVGDEPITRFYDDAGSAPDKVRPFEMNKLCYEYQSNNKGFFEFAAVRKQNSFVKSIKCRPCGLKGRYMIIQAMSPCTSCQNEESQRTSSSSGAPESKLAKSKESSSFSTSSSGTVFPFAVTNIEVYGYPIA